MLHAVEQMEETELEAFVQQILANRARHIAPHLMPNETQLIHRINTHIPEKFRLRARQLNLKRQAETLTEADHVELLRLNELIERDDVERTIALAKLAQLPRMTLAQVMLDLGFGKRLKG
jgi:hypothetical protein